MCPQWYGDRRARARAAAPHGTPPAVADSAGDPRPPSDRPRPRPPIQPRPAAGYAVLLGALSLMWGSSYLFIKIGVETLPPLSLVLLRVLVGLAILLVVVAVTRTPLPRDARTIGHLAVLGAVNIAIPFWLIGWAEQHINSGLAGILQSTAPFFTLVIAASLHPRRADHARPAGRHRPRLPRHPASSRPRTSPTSGARWAWSACSPSWPSWAPRSPMRSGTRTRGATSANTRPLVLSTGQVGSAAVFVAILALVVDGGVTLPAVPEAAFSVLWLGAIGTGFAYLVFFRLLTGWGPTRASLVAYLLPVVAVILGVVVLGETVDAFFLAGAALIVAGVWVVNRRG